MAITSPVQQIVPAVDALAELVEQAFADLGQAVRVVKGASVQVEDPDFVMICAPTDGGAGVLMQAEASDQGHAQQWRLDIVCLLSTWTGDRDVPGRMARVQQMLDVFCEVVATNSTLSGTVAVADVGTQSQLATFDNEQGTAAEIALTVTCEIY